MPFFLSFLNPSWDKMQSLWASFIEWSVFCAKNAAFSGRVVCVGCVGKTSSEAALRRFGIPSAAKRRAEFGGVDFKNCSITILPF